MILVVSYPDEDHTVSVIRYLEQLGRQVLLMDLADFPAHKGMALSWGGGGKTSYEVDGPHGPVDLRTAHVGWLRRVRPYTIDTAIASPSQRAFAQSETSQAIDGMLDALPCVWVNPRCADEAAHHKPYQ